MSITFTVQVTAAGKDEADARARIADTLLAAVDGIREDMTFADKNGEPGHAKSLHKQIVTLLWLAGCIRGQTTSPLRKD